MRRYLNLRKGDRRLNPLVSYDNLYEGDVFYFTCIGEKEELLPIYNTLAESAYYNCTLQQELYREEYWCEIMPKKATKANAIQQLKELWNCNRVISFGDAINDIPMFQISDECYAVENAVPALKKIATGIIAGNEQDGVAKWLNQNYDINQKL
jgi:hydroxymethylpyrimidine pyrophosphatase-like HAD family hydrolase